MMLALGGLFVSCDKKTLRSETQPSRLGVSDVGGVDGGPEGQATDTLGGSREQIATNGPNDAGNEVVRTEQWINQLADEKAKKAAHQQNRRTVYVVKP